MEKIVILFFAKQSRNANVIEFLLNDPNIDILNSGSSIFFPFSFVCGSKSYKKVFELFFKLPKFDIYSVDSKYHLSAFMGYNIFWIIIQIIMNVYQGACSIIVSLMII